MKFLIAKKVEMTQVYTEDGTVIPVTVLQAGPITVTQVKTAEHDGYQAVQVGFGTRKEKRTNNALKGHLKDLGSFSVLQEFRTTDTYERGQKLTAELFVPGDMVDVTGTSIGSGFAGVVKRHGFAGSPATHGHKDQLRRSGSVGSQAQQRVLKGMRMGGHMGAKQVTTKNIAVVHVDAATGRIQVKGAVPGANGALVCIKTAKNA